MVIKTKISYLGPPGTFTEEALDKYISMNDLEGKVEKLPYSNMGEVIKSVDRGEAAEGVVPIENSLEGSVNITLDYLTFETEAKITREKATELLSQAKGVTVIDDTASNKYPMPWEAGGLDDTYVGRIREDESIANGLNLWVVADNLRKGAALNAIQIAELL